ncbi:MAG TPA: hypothetical protein VEA63_12430, partial [Opitutus sp.]|nr:hypothetical protein [Opitutus sp.]
MNLEITARACLRVLGLVLMLASVPVFAADAAAPASEAATLNPAAPGNVDPIVSPTPMEFEAEGTGVHGQLVVA